MDIKTIPVARLIPFEPAGVRYRVERGRKQIKDSGTVDPIEVVDIDGQLVVKNGTNRVLALIEENMQDVPCRVRAPSDDMEVRLLRETIELRSKKHQGGFENVSILLSDGDRNALTMREEKEIADELFMKGLRQSSSS